MALDKRDLYRFPWSLNDNPIAWLEVTDVCNIHCEGCYRQHLTGHKTLEQVKEEVLLFKRWRNPDNVSIAGGEPLVYPHIMDLVAFIHEQGIKPVILTNGVALKPDILKELKKAGLSGFTIHIDSHQNRPKWQGKSEAELNALRQEFADMIHAEKGLYVIFNSTIYPSTAHEIPDILKWGQANVDRVQGLVFITYRTAKLDEQVASDAADQRVDLGKLSYVKDHFDEEFVTASDVYELLQKTCPRVRCRRLPGRHRAPRQLQMACRRDDWDQGPDVRSHWQADDGSSAGGAPLVPGHLSRVFVSGEGRGRHLPDGALGSDGAQGARAPHGRPGSPSLEVVPPRLCAEYWYHSGPGPAGRRPRRHVRLLPRHHDL